MFTVLVTDTGLDHSTSQIHFYHTRTVLFSPAVTIPSLRRPHSQTLHTTQWLASTLCSLPLSTRFIRHLLHFSNALLSSSGSFARSVSLYPRTEETRIQTSFDTRGFAGHWALLFSAIVFWLVYRNTVQCLFTVFKFYFYFKPQIKHPAGVKSDMFHKYPLYIP